jgi:hypothetical protein
MPLNYYKGTSVFGRKGWQFDNLVPDFVFVFPWFQAAALFVVLRK